MHGDQQFWKSLRDLERYDEQRHGEGENGVGKTFQPRDFGAPPMEPGFAVRAA